MLELLLELDATDEQLDSPVVFCLRPRPAPPPFHRQKPRHGSDAAVRHDSQPYPRARRATRKAALQLLISTIDYNDYVGRIGVGRIERGAISCRVKMAMRCSVPTNPTYPRLQRRVVGLYEIEGLKRGEPAKAPRWAISSAVSGY